MPQSTMSMMNATRTTMKAGTVTRVRKMVPNRLFARPQRPKSTAMKQRAAPMGCRIKAPVRFLRKVVLRRSVLDVHDHVKKC